MIMIVGTLLLNDDFSRVFFIFFELFIFGAVRQGGGGGGIKGQKMAQYDKNIWSGAIHIWETMHHMIVIYGTLM